MRTQALEKADYLVPIDGWQIDLDNLSMVNISVSSRDNEPETLVV